jgi:hypothetical protein
MGVKFEDLKKEREQRMKAGERPWWEKLADAFVAQYDAEAQAYQGGFSLAGDGLEYPQRQLKKNISGDEESWGLPDFSYDVNVGNRAGYRGTATVTDEIAEAGLDFGVDPVAPIVGGVGLAAKGIRTAHKLAGPRSLKGNTLSAPSNEINNHYKPSDTAQPNVVDELIMQNQETLSRVPKVGPRIRNLENTQDSANMREKLTSGAGWLTDSLWRSLNQTVSPSARALYREQQVTQTMQEKAEEALRLKTLKANHRATAQTQFTTNVANQAGRTGDVAEGVDGLNRRSFLTEPVKVTEFSYKDAIKSNNLKGSYASGYTAPVSDQDLDIIGEHVNNVWRDRKDRVLSETPEAEIRIKNAGAGDQVTGSHHKDFIAKSKLIPSIRRMFGDNKKLSERELWEKVKAESDANRRWNDKRNKDKQKPKWVLTERSETWEGAKDKGVWVTGSFTGDAITEGGVNYIAKISPNGRVMGVVSDEHNFLEKLPGVGPALDAALPNRSVSVTPPIHYDVIKNKEKIESVQPANKADVKESLFGIATAKPSDELLRAEKQVNAGVATASAGMLTGVGVRKDEER